MRSFRTPAGTNVKFAVLNRHETVPAATGPGGGQLARAPRRARGREPRRRHQITAQPRRV